MNQQSSTLSAPTDRVVVCPQCSGPSLYSARNAFRPFCSERCKLGDLGSWAREDFRLPDITPADTRDP